MKFRNAETSQLDLAQIRARLREKTGRAFWRSLEEAADTPAFREMLEREFPEQASELTDPVSRRTFLKVMGASLALAGVTGCARSPNEKIFPYVKSPEQFVPGRPLYYATAMTLGGCALGVLAESHLGRPTKIEGNELHPASLGATDVFAQAAVLSLYDPDRSQVVLEKGQISTWSAFLDALTRQLQEQRPKQGAGLRLLTETVSSPTLAGQIGRLLERFPEARWHQYEPANRDNAVEGSGRAFGRIVNPVYGIERADIILSLDADFLCSGPGGVRYAREFVRRRRPERMNRLYAVESLPTNTGTMADHRLALRASAVEAFTRAVAARFDLGADTPAAQGVYRQHSQWVDAVTADLKRHRGRSLVVAGEGQPPVVHALAHALNDALGNSGATVYYTDPVEARAENQTASLAALVEEMQAGKVEALVMLGGNPVFTAPADLGFGEKLLQVPFRAHLSAYEDETSFYCHWHVPETHFLESWSDARAFDGTASIVQPLVAPLYGGRSAHQLLAAMLGEPGRKGHDIVRDYWQRQRPEEEDFEAFWQRALHDGVVQDSARPRRSVSLQPDFRPGGRVPPTDRPFEEGLEIAFRPDPTIYDGRFANNGWLQELPKPLTKLTWDNAALLSPATAEQLGVQNGDVLELQLEGRTLAAAAWVLPGQAEGCVGLHFGYGRSRAGRVGTGTGFNAFALRSSKAPWIEGGLRARKTGRRHELVSTQAHHSLEGREHVRVGTLADYREHPGFAQERIHAPGPEHTLYPGFPYEGYAWGMAIDLNACTGCNACVVACQAENNIPVVGKEQVAAAREMHWIRVDRYFQGELDAPEIYHQPVPCMHCENAPCEPVCPVAATTHSSEGLNEMTYNRCVGTRYCSNNCPYKVRRFNFLSYSDWKTESLKPLRNPDVTVRSRGVMEKCTYCVQRINQARIEAKSEGRSIRDGEIVTACQGACPTEAIVFGDINDPESRVSKRKAEARDYSLLAELNTRPRTTYQARLRNPNPELEAN